MSRITINSNILSLNAQRQVSKHTQDLRGSFDRLSSGLRITKASDDAAGLAISENLRTDARLSTQAIRNVNDGISMISIISGALDAQKGILYRMAELAEQSANGTNSTVQRNALQREYSSLQEEFQRIAETTEFNDIQLLKVSEPSQIGLMTGITGSSDSLLEATIAQSDLYSGDVATRWYFSGMQNAAVQLNNFGPLLFDPEFGDVSGSGRTQDYRVIYTQNSLGEEAVLKLSTFGDAGIASRHLIALGYEADGVTESYGSVQSAAEVDNQVSITVTHATSGATITEVVDLSASNFSDIYFNGDSARNSAIAFTNVQGRTSSRRSLDTIRNRIDDLSKLQGEFGAIESRLQVAANTLSVSRENFAAAASQITDVDVATEAAALTSSQILQNAAAAILGQANQQPQIALQLLGGL